MFCTDHQLGGRLFPAPPTAINPTVHAEKKPQQPVRTWPQKANPALLHLVSQGNSGALVTLDRLNRTPRAHQGFPWSQITPLEETRQATSTCFPESRASASPKHHKHAHKPWEQTSVSLPETAQTFFFSTGPRFQESGKV